MSGFDATDQGVVEPIVSYFNADSPKIAQGMKNFIAYIVGGASIPSLPTLESKLSPAMVSESTPVLSSKTFSLSSSSSSSSGATAPPIDMAQALRVAKLILSAINTVGTSLPPVEEWTALHPQEKEQTGEARIEQVLRYKVARNMCRASATKHVSVCKVFGRELLRDLRLWPEVLAVVQMSLGEGDEVALSFLERFGKSVTTVMERSAASTGTTNDQDEHEHCARLVWSSDFDAELSKLRQERAAAVAERLKRQGDTDEYMAQVRSALSLAAPAGTETHTVATSTSPEASIPRVEELS